MLRHAILLAAMAALFAVALAGSPARGTVLVESAPLPPEWLVRRADLIVVGTVTDARARWEGKRIVTDLELRVDRPVRGRPDASTIRVRAPGGSVDGIAMRVLGAPTFRLGDRALLFLVRRGDVHRLAGLGEAKLPIVRGADGIDRVVLPTVAIELERMIQKFVKDDLR